MIRVRGFAIGIFSGAAIGVSLKLGYCTVAMITTFLGTVAIGFSARIRFDD